MLISSISHAFEPSSPFLLRIYSPNFFPSQFPTETARFTADSIVLFKSPVLLMVTRKLEMVSAIPATFNGFSLKYVMIDVFNLPDIASAIFLPNLSKATTPIIAAIVSGSRDNRKSPIPPRTLPQSILANAVPIVVSIPLTQVLSVVASASKSKF